MQFQRKRESVRDYEQKPIEFLVPRLPLGSIINFFKIPSSEILKQYETDIIYLSEKYLKHEFNLLGSGWVKVCHGMTAEGFEGHFYKPGNTYDEKNKFIMECINTSNRDTSLKIIENISADYKLIDWQLDYKSGYRWCEKDWFKDIHYGNNNGADIKLPWEIGRMQHLPILAYASAHTNNHLKSTNFYSEEFKNQILDFIASNPPRFGVQWASTMDVALRAVSWLAAYDMFISSGVKFDEEFADIFHISIYQHLIHILENPEWSSGMRGNHYLANIAGIIFISAYLNGTTNENEVQNYLSCSLAFGIQEIINEVLHQFNEDGSNFEASTSYHCFTADMVICALYIIMSLPGEKIEALKNFNNKVWKYNKRLLPPHKQIFKVDAQNCYIIFPSEFMERISAIIKFSESILDKSCEIIQIGDNDSGRFLKLLPAGNNYLHIELFNILSNRSNVLYDNLKLIKSIIPEINNNRIAERNYIGVSMKSEDTTFGIKDKITLDEFPDFGLYVFKSDLYKLYFRCGSIGQMGKGGHSHNDQLSICLSINEQVIFTDPGTYVYTPSWQLRNKYRSTYMHNTLAVEGMEQNYWDTSTKDDLFWLRGDRTKSKVLMLSNDYIEAVYYGYDKPHILRITFDSSEIIIEDICDSQKEKSIRFHLHPKVLIDSENVDKLDLRYGNFKFSISSSNNNFAIEDYKYSPNYGESNDAKVLVIKLNSNENKTIIKINES